MYVFLCNGHYERCIERVWLLECGEKRVHFHYFRVLPLFEFSCVEVEHNAICISNNNVYFLTYRTLVLKKWFHGSLRPIFRDIEYNIYWRESSLYIFLCDVHQLRKKDVDKNLQWVYQIYYGRTCTTPWNGVKKERLSLLLVLYLFLDKII